MIYDPKRAALELRQRIIDSMTNEELIAYVHKMAAIDSKGVVIRLCEKCLADRVLETKGESVRCGCGASLMDEHDRMALLDSVRL